MNPVNLLSQPEQMRYVLDHSDCALVFASPDWAAKVRELVKDIARPIEVVEVDPDAEKLPGATVTDAGGLTKGELLERPTKAPPAGACPLSITMPCGCAPPLILDGEIVSDFNEGDCTVNCAEAEAELSVAVRVTGVGAVTCPACTWN